MDIDQLAFYPTLPDILINIAESHFVAIDLELSGVPTKKPRQDAGKQTLQERYLETKEAAERYQILQIGITCVAQDTLTGCYNLRPYNFDLSPLIQERGLEVERIFSFQSGAAEFLQKVGFDIGRPFRSGVPYLSRIESREARDKHNERQVRTAVTSIDIKPTEVESLAFLERVRSLITKWLGDDYPHYLNINSGGTAASENESPAAELGRYEKRLVYQLVEAEYPDLVSFARNGLIQIRRYDKDREKRIQAERKHELEDRINRQKGFRWIVDALLGRPVSKINLHDCARDPHNGCSPVVDLNRHRAKIQRAHSHMLGNPKVMVGHNCFLDLAYLYRTFIGRLPDTIEEFSQAIHNAWPLVVDTKYMSTHNCGDINPMSSLEQIAGELAHVPQPPVSLVKGHGKYETVESFHEAGYDSFLTAQVMVRLASKLFREGKHLAGDESLPNSSRSRTEPALKDLADVIEATLTITEDEEEFTPSVPGQEWIGVGDPTVKGKSGPNDPFEFDPGRRKNRFTPFEVDSDEVPGDMARFGDQFWHVYGNKLRVFGTEEAVCVLGDSTAPSLSPDPSGGVKI